MFTYLAVYRTAYRLLGRSVVAKSFRPTPTLRLGNVIVSTLLRRGFKLGGMALLTVPGRKSGLPRSTPIFLVERDGGRWLASPYGEVNWVRNLRAAGRATLTRGGRSEAIAAVELSPDEAAPILKQALASAPGFIRQYFDVTADSSLEEIAREAPRHPLFRISHLPA
jgi:deazaflavin-dependent oxidoreductase (nitroreductase family)